jgi:hypothetical protein
LEHARVQLYWLKIAVYVEEEDRLLELIGSKMQRCDPPSFAARKRP